MGTSTTRSRGKWASLKPGLPVVWTGLKANSVVAEDYRKIAVQIEQTFLSASSEGRILAVTSPEPMSGKTLTSLNLALLLARRGERRVLLLEADLWRPSMHRYVEMGDGLVGLTQVLGGTTSIQDTIASLWGVGLDIVSAGTMAEASDLVTGERLIQIGSELRSRYDLVIVDCPPVLLSGGQSLVNWADKTVVVVKARTTSRGSVEEALELLGPTKTLGIILNNVRLRDGHPYEYYNYKSGSRDTGPGPRLGAP